MGEYLIFCFVPIYIDKSLKLQESQFSEKLRDALQEIIVANRLQLQVFSLKINIFGL